MAKISVMLNIVILTDRDIEVSIHRIDCIRGAARDIIAAHMKILQRGAHMTGDEVALSQVGHNFPAHRHILEQAVEFVHGTVVL